MSEYPKVVPFAYECNTCGIVHYEKHDAIYCCHPRVVRDAWDCAVDGCQTQIHRTRQQAEVCIRAAAKVRAKG